MYLSSNFARELINLGFKRTIYCDEIAPFDFYRYEGEEWVLGGRILPVGPLLAPKNIYKEGQWLPSIDDLVSWLVDYKFKFALSYHEDHGFKVEVTDDSGKVFNGKGGTSEHALYNVIVKILKTNKEIVDNYPKRETIVVKLVKLEEL